MAPYLSLGTVFSVHLVQSQPYSTTGNITVSYILILKFLERNNYLEIKITFEHMEFTLVFIGSKHLVHVNQGAQFIKTRHISGSSKDHP